MMSRIIRLWITVVTLVLFLAAVGIAPKDQARAQTPREGIVATIDIDAVEIDETRERLEIALPLSEKVPFRVFTLSNPDRLIVDVQDVDWDGLPVAELKSLVAIRDLRYGMFQPGWSRLVIDLAKPMIIETAHIYSGTTTLSLALQKSDRTVFDNATGHHNDGRWTHTVPEVDAMPASGNLRIALDPGHGGIDPGAIRHGVMEKDIALAFATELAELLRDETEYEVYLTRTEDAFLSLRDRVRLSQEADADIFISIHSNTVTFGNATGAALYTLSERASDLESRKLAELENRADLSAGLDIQVEEDAVAKILVDLARGDTNARSRILADSLVSEFRDAVGVLRTKPHRSAGFRVLKAHDMPSVLLELGFMSNDRDLRNMNKKEWRAKAAKAVIAALKEWEVKDRARAKLVLK